MSILENIPPELIENFKKGRAVYFVGAGLSVGSGYPTWDGLLRELIDLADSKSWISKDRISEYRELANDPSKFLFLAEDLKTEIGKTNFSEFLENKFSDPSKKPNNNHYFLVKSNAQIILTINYDSLIEKAYNEVYNDWPNTFIYSQSKQAANNFWKGKFFILKAHGDAKTDIDSIILSQRDYRKTLYRETGYRSLLQSIFSTKSIVFLGVSMTDPEFIQLLDYLHDSYHGGGPLHYLLLDERSNLQTMSKRYLEEFKIETIPFNNDSGDFSELTSFLKEVSEEAPSRI